MPCHASRNNYFDPFGDYSGQTYLIVAKASGVERFRHHPVMRYLEFAVGYGTRGSGAPPDVPSDPSRNVYLGISINLSELLGQTAFAGSTPRGGMQRAVNRFFQSEGRRASQPDTPLPPFPYASRADSAYSSTYSR